MTKKIAVITASWNEEIVESARDSFITAIGKKAQVDVFKVPGSLEIPLTGKWALDGDYDVAVGIGFVVNGGIYRHEFVAHTVVQSILDVSIATGKPFLSVVLTPQAFNEDSPQYQDMFVKHMVLKGEEAAKAALRMLDVPGEVHGQRRAA